MVTPNGSIRSVRAEGLILGLALVVGIGLTPAAQAADAPDQLVPEDEFSALFEPEPTADPPITTRGLAKIPQPSLNVKKREVTTYVLFETGSVLLQSPESFRQLDIAGLAFKKALEAGKAGKWVIEVVGHTDNVGSPQSNLKLSKARAEGVRLYLLDAYGLPPNMVIAQGYGDTQPIASNDTPEGRKQNRRVVFRVTQRTASDTP